MSTACAGQWVKSVGMRVGKEMGGFGPAHGELRTKSICSCIRDYGVLGLLGVRRGQAERVARCHPALNQGVCAVCWGGWEDTALDGETDPL